MLLISDEIHHDLVFDGAKHTAMALVDASISDRLVMMTSATKTFNIAGAHTGNVIISDPALRVQFASTMAAFGMSPNSFGLFMATAAYSLEGAVWVDALCDYLAENKRIFDEGINAIPGLQSMPLESTYLAWVDFSGTGMSPQECINRVEQTAKIAANHGDTFGTGGEQFLRFNLATPKSVVQQAVQRMQEAFADLQ